MASPAFAQAAAPVDTTPQKTQENQRSGTTSTSPTNAQGQPIARAGGETIVVTGSRIRRDNFSTPQSVDIVTRQDQILAGTRTTAETLQSATITSGTAQISGSFLGFVSEGGQAAETVGLRGLGSSRTLVLLNGRRLAPAGVGNQLIAADLNVLPTSIVQRIEVLRGGASSVYGSDAIAGVINIITDTSINGVTVDGFANHPIYGSGDTLRGSITAGKTFDRGHITASFEYTQKDGLRLGDRADTSCPRDLFFVNGVEVGQRDPSTGRLRCFPFQYDGLGIASGYGLFFNFTNGRFGRATFPGYTTGNPSLFGPPVVVNNINLRPSPSPTQLLDHVISPVKTYTAYVNGAYDLGILGDSELYGEALYTRRNSHQDFASQISIDQKQLGYGVQVYGGNYAGTPLQAFGYPVSPYFPVSFANAGINLYKPFIVPNKPQYSTQRVDFFRGNAGLRGNVGLGDWRYDANYQVSRTRSVEDVLNINTSNFRNALTVSTDAAGNPIAAPAGTPAQFITTGLPGQSGAGIGYTCASNVTNGAYNGGQCVPINIFDPQVVLFGNLPQGVYNYIYQQNFDHTKFNQDTAQLVFDGSLFSLPGGPAKGALGFEHRRDYIKDVPSIAARTGNLYNRATAGITEGSDIVNEAFGEVDLPFFKDRPGLSLLELDASGRYTHYRSYGSDFTYHVSGQWAPIPAIRFRGNYGTNFRAPNLYEQFVADQTGFYGGSTDPCSDFGILLDPSSQRYKNCLAALTPILGANAINYVDTSSIQVTTRGGHGQLKSEHARNWGFGAVFTLPRRIADLSLTVDYWNITVKDEVSTLGSTILDLCYDAADFPTNKYCSFIGPRLGASAGGHAGDLTTLDNPYLNVAKQQTSGIDFNVRYATPLAGGHFQTQLQVTRNLHQKLQLFAGDTNFDYNGTLGYPGFGAGPKWVGSLDTRFTTPNNITFRWGVKFIGRQSSNKLVTPFTIGGQPVKYDLVAEAYLEHGVSVQWQWPTIGQVTLGVSNVFNKKPPTISGFPSAAGQYFRIGNYFGGGDYDYYGRSLFVNVTRSFK